MAAPIKVSELPAPVCKQTPADPIALPPSRTPSPSPPQEPTLVPARYNAEEQDALSETDEVGAEVGTSADSQQIEQDVMSETHEVGAERSTSTDGQQVEGLEQSAAAAQPPVKTVKKWWKKLLGR
jgi:hypothetical protein